MLKFDYFLPPSLLVPVIIHRSRGYFDSEGMYRKNVQLIPDRCFIEPLEETSKLERGGYRELHQCYIHSQNPLYNGGKQSNTRDQIAINGVLHAITKLDAWPQYGYWCALTCRAPTETREDFSVINQHIRQLVHRLVQAQPGSVRPAYQEAPFSYVPFIGVEIESVNQESESLQYDQDQEYLEGQRLLRAHIFFFQERLCSRAFPFFCALSSSEASDFLTQKGIGLAQKYPPKKEGHCTVVAFDFYNTHQTTDDYAEISQVTYHVIYDKR